jgi:branched-chain amino acid aminotransferase
MSKSTEIKSPKSEIDFSSLPWNLNLPEEHTYLHLTCGSEGWTDNHYNLADDSGSMFESEYKYSDRQLPIYPATTSLNYGTTIWEGLKVYRSEDGRPIAFRPDRNYERFARGAVEMCIPVPSRELFMRSIQFIVQKNSHLIPPPGDGMKLYVRPMLYGSGTQLGLYPSQQFSLLFYVSPTGNYFKSATGGLQLHLETKRARAARGGLGNVKCSGNYAAALKPLMDAKKQGFHDNIYLELETYKPGALGDAVLQEMSAANVFLVLKTGEIVTPSLDRGTILPGVTRESILVLIENFASELTEAMKESTGQSNVTASSRDVTVKEFQEATEAFCTGTAAELVPVASVATGEGEEEFKVVFKHGTALPGGPVSTKLLQLLREVMVGKRTCDAMKGWLRDPSEAPEVFCHE